MASPGFYEDRARAARAASEHRELKEEVGTLMAEWEQLQTVVETAASR